MPTPEEVAAALAYITPDPHNHGTLTYRADTLRQHAEVLWLALQKPPAPTPDRPAVRRQCNCNTQAPLFDGCL